MSTSAEVAQLLASERQRRGRALAQAVAVLAVVLVSCAASGLLDVPRVWSGIEQIAGIVADGLPPDFTGASSWVQPLLDTLAMSIAGTTLAVVLSVPLALLAARRTSPSPLVYGTARVLLNALRSVPELIMGILFVAAVGFGALPGVLALGLHSVGMVGKFFAESIERLDPAQLEPLEASGASRLQVIGRGVLPQVLPQMADTAIYRWEYNFRASTLLGLVGAGGIGAELITSLRLLQYQQVTALLLVILVTVTVVDGLGTLLRRRFA